MTYSQKTFFTFYFLLIVHSALIYLRDLHLLYVPFFSHFFISITFHKVTPPPATLPLPSPVVTDVCRPRRFHPWCGRGALWGSWAGIALASCVSMWAGHGFSQNVAMMWLISCFASFLCSCLVLEPIKVHRCLYSDLLVHTYTHAFLNVQLVTSFFFLFHLSVLTTDRPTNYLLDFTCSDSATESYHQTLQCLSTQESVLPPFSKLVWFWFTLTALISPAFSRRRQLFSANKGQRSEIHCNQTADKVSISLVNIVQVKKNTI